MSRGLSVAQINASAGFHRVTTALFEMEFTSGTLRLAVFPWDLTVGLDTYTRAPLRLSDTKESSISSEGIELAMSGFDPSIIALATSEQYQGRTFRILKAYIHPDSNQVIDQPRAFFNGRMRNIVCTETNSSVDVSLFVEHYDVELTRAMPLRYTDADQQRLFPGDRGCEYAPSNADKTVIWPSKEAQKYSGGIHNGAANFLRRFFRD